MNPILIFVGEEVNCPECRELIATVDRPIYSRDAIGSEHFAFVTDEPEVSGKCPECEADWVTFSPDGEQIEKIHLARGWIPGDGQDQKPTHLPFH